jgi:hypothetical protein
MAARVFHFMYYVAYCFEEFISGCTDEWDIGLSDEQGPCPIGHDTLKAFQIEIKQEDSIEKCHFQLFQVGTASVPFLKLF